MLLVLALLGGGLVCLLVVNTTLGVTSFQIDRLQQQASSETSQAQTLEQQIAAEEAPQQIQNEAYALGMRSQPTMEFLDLGTHQIHAEHVAARRLPGRPRSGR